jgi:hypothetical protein
MITFNPTKMLTPLALSAVGLISTVMTTTPAMAESQTYVTQFSEQRITQTGVGKVDIRHNQQIDIIESPPTLILPRGGMNMTIMRQPGMPLDRDMLGQSAYDAEAHAQRHRQWRQEHRSRWMMQRQSGSDR